MLLHTGAVVISACAIAFSSFWRDEYFARK
jgi:hypothetical protein